MPTRRKVFDLPLTMHLSAAMLRFYHLLFYIFPACAYGGVKIYLSSLASRPEEMPSIWGLETIIHFIEYYILGYLIFWCFSHWVGGPFPQRRAILWTVSISVL